MWLVPLQASWHAVQQWSDRSQQGARRNAMLACTALAQHRADVREVDELLALASAQPSSQRSAQSGAQSGAPSGTRSQSAGPSPT